MIIDAHCHAFPKVGTGEHGALTLKFLHYHIRRKHRPFWRMDDNTRVDYHLLDGPTDKSIVDFARDENADWLIVGTHGHTGLKHIVLGSIAERVLRHAPCSVLVVREPHA